VNRHHPGVVALVRRQVVDRDLNEFTGCKRKWRRRCSRAKIEVQAPAHRDVRHVQIGSPDVRDFEGQGGQNGNGYLAKFERERNHIDVWGCGATAGI
jgi:hypothetical protein